ncbi:hypothetical protein USB125703_01327 [Pseudoclavibacter triregionum]|nr:hypothetical protein USB125703_01327 [Pseudoclavibacter triregionum]
MGPDELLRLAPAAVAALGLAAVTPGLVATDLREHRLPNRLVGMAALALVPALGLAWAVAGAGAVSGALLAGAVAGLAYFVLAVAGGMGMGDVKLAAVLACGGALAAPVVAIGGALAAFLLGGTAAAVALSRRALARGAAARSAASGTGERGEGPARIAFGPWMLAGHWLALACWAGMQLA